MSCVFIIVNTMNVQKSKICFFVQNWLDLRFGTVDQKTMKTNTHTKLKMKIIECNS